MEHETLIETTLVTAFTRLIPLAFTVCLELKEGSNYRVFQRNQPNHDPIGYLCVTLPAINEPLTAKALKLGFYLALDAPLNRQRVTGNFEHGSFVFYEECVIDAHERRRWLQRPVSDAVLSQTVNLINQLCDNEQERFVRLQTARADLKGDVG